MIFPIGDDNVIGGCKPIFSYAFIVMNVAIFLLQISTPGNLVCEFATIPQDIIDGQNYHTLITSMFMHGGWMHLLGNMLFLWIFADNIEATVGNMMFLLFYILGGLIAAGVHIYFEQYTGSASLACCKVCEVADCQTPCPGYIPSLGASGAISAVMGAYLVMFPKSKIKMIFIIFFSTFTIPAFLFLLFWFGQQVFSGVGSLGPASAQTAGVAWWAHIGGFVFGLLFGFIFRGKAKVKPAYHGKDYV